MAERLPARHGEASSSSGLDLDVERLRRYLLPRVPGVAGGITLQPLAGGQSNPTYLLRADGHRYALRRKPFGALLPSAHAIEREVRVMQALAGRGVPVPCARWRG